VLVVPPAFAAACEIGLRFGSLIQSCNGLPRSLLRDQPGLSWIQQSPCEGSGSGFRPADWISQAPLATFHQPV